jgi:hypothetical protein
MQSTATLPVIGMDIATNVFQLHVRCVSCKLTHCAACFTRSAPSCLWGSCVAQAHSGRTGQSPGSGEAFRGGGCQCSGSTASLRQSTGRHRTAGQTSGFHGQAKPPHAGTASHTGHRFVDGNCFSVYRHRPVQLRSDSRRQIAAWLRLTPWRLAPAGGPGRWGSTSAATPL